MLVRGQRGHCGVLDNSDSMSQEDLGEHMRIRLLVVDDHPLLRLGLVRVARENDDIDIVGESTHADAGRVIARADPTVILVGTHAPNASVIATANRLRRPHVGIVILDDTDDPALMLRALDAGLSAYVSKSATTSDIISAIRHAHVCPRGFTAPGLAHALRADQAHASLLSDREQQVLLLLRDGYSGSEIADRLGVADSSVKTYVTRIYSKLAVTNRSQAVMTALGRGLLPLGEAA